MFPVSPAFCPCLVWVVTERGGEGGDCVIRWWIVIDKLWSKVTENERKTRGKQSRKRLPDIQLRVCLDLSVGPLPSLLIYWTYAPLTFATPSSLCSDGAVGEWSERTAEDAGPGEPQLLHTGEEDLRVEPPAADTAIRLGQLYERWRDVCVFRRVFTHNKDAENANFRCMFWDGSHYSKFWSKLMFFDVVSGTDYIYMNSAVYRNGTSFVESLFETFGEFDFQHDAVICTPIYMYMSWNVCCCLLQTASLETWRTSQTIWKKTRKSKMTL